MTIVELRDRLTNIIESNEAHGWHERNASDIVVSIKPSQRITEYYTIQYACGAWLGLANGKDNVFELIAINKPRARYGYSKRS